MKLIFLDIDGVLNSLSSNIACNGGYAPDGISKESLGLLKFVVKHTDARIVISSTWRSYGSHEWFCGLFEAYGWRRPPIIGCTRPSKSGEIRGDQINDWITEYGSIEKYVCIDDDSDFHPNQNHVKTRFTHGFQLEHAIECIDILGNINDETSISDLKVHLTT